MIVGCKVSTYAGGGLGIYRLRGFRHFFGSSIVLLDPGKTLALRLGLARLDLLPDTRCSDTEQHLVLSRFEPKD